MFDFLTPTFIISVLIALSVHEWSHGFVANALGDPTAKMEGRLTLNPLAHLDPIGTLLFILIGFGWGKPVPVNPHYFTHVKWDTALVALAGPVSNLILALIAFFLLLIIGESGAIIAMSGATIIPDHSTVTTKLLSELSSDLLHINLVLMAFNLLPIAPLDGSKILQAFIPLRHEDTYQAFMQNGPRILLILIVLGHFLHVPILSMWIGLIIAPVLQLFSVIAGML